MTDVERGTEGSEAGTSGNPRWIRTWIGLLVGGLLLVWVATRVDLARVWTMLFSVHPGWLAAAVLVKLSAVPVKAGRWNVVLRSAVGADVTATLRATWLGYAGNVVLPMRLGELVRIRIAQRHNPPVRFTPGLGTVVLERMIDGSIVLAVFTLAGLFTIQPRWAERGAATFGGLVLSGVAVLALMMRSQRTREWLLARLPGVLSRFVGGLFEGLRLMRRPRPFAVALLLSVLAWSLEVAGTLCLLRSGNLALGWPEAAFLTAAVALGLTAPSAPAGLGTHQFVYVSVLGALGVSAEVATALSVLGMTSVAVSLVAIAVPIGIREGNVNPRRLRARTAVRDEEA